MMTPVNQKGERASGGKPTIEMKKEAMQQVFDKRPNGRAGGDGTRRLRRRELARTRPHDDAKCRYRHPKENDGGETGARKPFEKIAAKQAQRPPMFGPAIAGVSHVTNGLP